MVASTSLEEPETKCPAEISVRATVSARPGMRMMMDERMTKGGLIPIPLRAAAEAPATKAARMSVTGRHDGVDDERSTIRKSRNEMVAAVSPFNGLGERMVANAPPVRIQERACPAVE